MWTGEAHPTGSGQPWSERPRGAEGMRDRRHPSWGRPGTALGWVAGDRVGTRVAPRFAFLRVDYAGDVVPTPGVAGCR